MTCRGECRGKSLPISAGVIDSRGRQAQANGKHLRHTLNTVNAARQPKHGNRRINSPTYACFIFPPQSSILSCQTSLKGSGTTFGASCISRSFFPVFSRSSVIRQKNRDLGSAEWPVRSSGRSDAGREEMMFMHFGVEMHDGRSVSSRVTP